jgi:hypothetical protein
MILWKSAAMENGEAGSWLQQRICGCSREIMVNGGVWGGGGARLCLGFMHSGR